LKVTQLTHQIKDPLYRNSLFLMVNTAVTTGMGFIFWMVVARYYTEHEVGLAAAIISAISLLSLISSLGLDVALVRFLSKAKEPVKMINSSFTICGIVALVVTGIFLAGLDLWSPATEFVRGNIRFLLAFILFTICWPLSGLMSSVFIARRRAEYVLVKSTIFSLLKIPLPILLVYYFHAFGIVGSWGLAAVAAFVVSVFLFMPRVQESYRPVPRLDPGIIRDIWKYSTGNYFVSIFASAPYFLLPIIVVNLISAEQNAYFYVAWMMAGLVYAIPVAVSSSLFAEGSHSEEALVANARRSFRFIILLLVPAIILLVALGKWLLLLFGENYSSNALTLLWILGASGLFIAVNDVYYSILRVRGRIRELFFIRALISIAVIIAGSLIAPKTGIVGIGYAWISAQAVASIYVLLTVGVRYRAMKLRRTDS
jgi:O-antigen/teichoic acid export membrane protein